MFWSRQCRARNKKEKGNVSANCPRQFRQNKTKFQNLCKENNVESLIIGDIDTLNKSIGKAKQSNCWN